MTNQEINEAVAKELGHAEWILSYSTNPQCRDEILNHINYNRSTMSAAFMNALRDVLAPWMPKNKAGSPIISDFDLLMASPKEICLAFLKVKGVKV